MHKGMGYPGEHQAIIDGDLWGRAHAIFDESPRKRANNRRSQTPTLLKGLLFTATGAAVTPSSTKKGTRQNRYYVSMDVIKNRDALEEDSPRRLVPDTVEGAVINEIRRVLWTPETLAQVLATLARDGHHDFAEADAIAALKGFQGLWGQLFPAEQARIIQLLVRRVSVRTEGLVLDLRTDGIAGVMRVLMMPRRTEAAA